MDTTMVTLILNYGELISTQAITNRLDPTGLLADYAIVLIQLCLSDKIVIRLC